MRLQNKTCLITGGSSGIGKATAIRFAQEGANIIIIDINEQDGSLVCDSLDYRDCKPVFIKADVSKSGELDEAVEKVIAIHSSIDVIFNCAGIGGRDAVTESPLDSWEKVINTNLTGTFLVSKHFIPIIGSQEGGSIINVASIAGFVAFKRTAAYSASKGGIISLTKNMAVDYASQKIRVNCICPGTIDTSMTKKLLNNIAYKEGVEKSTPLGRIGQPSDIANVALFLASDESSFITGQSIVADGGFSICNFSDTDAGKKK